MTDQVRLGQTLNDINKPSSPLVTLDVVSREFVEAGLPRSMRTLQRYCMNGTLDCVKEATDTGDTYFVAEPSIERAIVSLRQLHEAKSGQRHAATERAMSNHDAPDNESPFPSDHDGLGPTQSDDNTKETAARQPTTVGDMSGHVAQLQQRLDEKDEEIAFLREELIDRRGQIKDMKGIIDGQNALLDTIQTNVAPIFKALASTVETKRIRLTPSSVENKTESNETIREDREFQPQQHKHPRRPEADEQRYL